MWSALGHQGDRETSVIKALVPGDGVGPTAGMPLDGEQGDKAN